MRIGHGYDLHIFAPGRRLVLCGVDIPFEKGLLGHSDADVAAHAAADALLGAAALGDIGALFPDTDPAYKDADSIGLLSAVAEKVRRSGYAVSNIDITVILQRPKISPYIPQMRQNIASACGLDIGSVSVKATTEEGVGPTGQGVAAAAHAVCLIEAAS